MGGSWSITAPFPEVAEVTVQVVRSYQDPNDSDTTMYVIKCSFDGSDWYIHRRFREVAKLHKRLSGSLREHRLEESLPCPPKTVFHHTDERFVARRQSQLSLYFRHIAARAALWRSKAMREFFAVSSLSFQRTLGKKGHEGWLRKGPGGRFLSHQTFPGFGLWRRRWFVLKDSCIIYAESPDSDQPLGVLLVDTHFSVIRDGSSRRIVFRNSTRTIETEAPNDNEYHRWLHHIAVFYTVFLGHAGSVDWGVGQAQAPVNRDFRAPGSFRAQSAPVDGPPSHERNTSAVTAEPCVVTPRIRRPAPMQGPRRAAAANPPTASHAPLRRGVFVCPLVQGEAYFAAVARAMLQARMQIFIAGWWVWPDVPLVRTPPAGAGDSGGCPVSASLLDILLHKARQGVHSYVLLYREVELADLPNQSAAAESALATADPEHIHVLRHPNHYSLFAETGNSYKYSHHEKVVVVDQKVAFVGGMDLARGRFDTGQGRLLDSRGPGERRWGLRETWFGRDWYNPGIEAVLGRAAASSSSPSAERRSVSVDPSLYPRLPWHDVAVAVGPPAAGDVAFHFIERWNHHRCSSKKPTPLLVPFSDVSHWWETTDALIPPLPGETQSEEAVRASRMRAARGSGMSWWDDRHLPLTGCGSLEWERQWIVRASRYCPTGFLQLLRRHHHQWQLDDTTNIGEEGGGHAGVGGRCSVQLVRSVGAWSLGLPGVPEASVAQAYVYAIRHAQRYIYLENQFFISSTSWKSPGTSANGSSAYPYPPLRDAKEGSRADPRNLVLAALLQRLRQAMNRREVFRVILVLPVYPEGDFVDGRSEPHVMRFQAQTLVRGAKSLVRTLQAEFGDEVLWNYLSLCSLRHVEPVSGDVAATYWRRMVSSMGLSAGTRVERPAAFPEHDRDDSNGMWSPCLISEQCYVHSKLLLVDDQLAVIGSANVNDRSLAGSADSEVSFLISSRPSDAADNPANSVVGQLRQQLWRQHLGLPDDFSASALHDPTGFDAYWRLWMATALHNTRFFDRYFPGAAQFTLRSMWSDPQFAPLGPTEAPFGLVMRGGFGTPTRSPRGQPSSSSSSPSPGERPTRPGWTDPPPHASTGPRIRLLPERPEGAPEAPIETSALSGEDSSDQGWIHGPVGSLVWYSTEFVPQRPGDLQGRALGLVLPSDVFQ